MRKFYLRRLSCVILAVMMLAITACGGKAETERNTSGATLAGKRDATGEAGNAGEERAGSDVWNEWKEAMGESSGQEEAYDEDDAEADDEAGQSSMNDKIGDMLNDGSGDETPEVGEWELFTLTQNGKSYMEDDLKAKGVESRITVNPDGTGQIFLVGKLMDMEWGNGQIIVPENDEGKRDEYRYSLNGGFLILVDEDMTLAFRKVEE